MKARRRGFTLTELIVTIGLLSLFSTAVVATLAATLNFWRSSNSRVTAEQNVRMAMQFITLEVRQSIAVPDPITGWQSIQPALTVPTGVLMPNPNVRTSAQLIFQEMNPTVYDPTAASFDETDSLNYQRVRFYITNNELHREVITYGVGGTSATTNDLAVVSATKPGGILTMTTELTGDNFVTITVSTLEGECAFSLTTSVIALGQ
jgi:prepilin-type N-terminal cleavage/methylation domain-containing protein